MLKKLNWQVYSSKDRHVIIDEVNSIFLTNDACIVNSSMFSDLALSLSLEIPQNRVVGLHQTLSSIVSISDLELTNINTNSSKDCMIFLNISFSTGTGNLKIETPDVPG